MGKKISKNKIKEIVNRRVNTLLELAKNNKRERNYVHKAWELIKKYKVRRTKEQKIMFCKRCYSLWTEGKYKVKIDKKNKRVIYRCLSCGYEKVFGYK